MVSTHVSPVARKLEARKKVMFWIAFFVSLDNYYKSEHSIKFLTVMSTTIVYNVFLHNCKKNFLFKDRLNCLGISKFLTICKNWTRCLEVYVASKFNYRMC